MPDEVQVRDVQERGFERADDRRDLRCRRDRGEHETGDDERDERRGQQSAKTTRVEAGESNRTAAGDVAEQELRNEETRQDEEDVDADEAAREAADPRVKQHDEIHGERAQSVEMRAVRRFRFPRLEGGRRHGRIGA